MDADLLTADDLTRALAHTNSASPIQAPAVATGGRFCFAASRGFGTHPKVVA